MAFVEDNNSTTIGSVVRETFEAIVNDYETTINPIHNFTGVRNMKVQLTLYGILAPAICVLIIMTNFVVVLSSGLLLKRGVNPKATYLFLGNVAMADLVTGAAVLFGTSYPKTNRTHFLCTIEMGLIVSSTLASIYSVGLIAVDRFLYIIHGLKYHRWVYPTRARLMIFFTWMLGIVIGFIPATGLWSGSTNGGKRCWFTTVLPPGLMLLTTAIGILPVLLVVVLYSIILYYAIKKVIQLRKADKNREDRTVTRTGMTSARDESRIFRGGNVEANETAGKNKQAANNKPSKVKAVKVVLLTCGSFVITWVPYFISSVIVSFCEPEAIFCKTMKTTMASPLAMLGLLNSLLNPLIYAWWHNGFRNFTRRILCKGSKTKNHELSSSTTKSSRFSRRTDSGKSRSDRGNETDENMHVVQLEHPS